MRRPLLIVLCLTLLSALCSPPIEAAQKAKKITSVEGITEYRLENGMKVLLFPDPSAPKVTVNLTVFVGSRHEGYGETGMAHLLEHMLFKGTPTHQNIPKLLTDRGASFNGTTWLDRTNYYETLPAEGDNLEVAIRLEADRMVNSSILASELAKEMTVVRNEFERGENSPRRILSQRMTAVAFEWHNYGKATIGNRADIERVPVDRLRAFYRKYYQPDNAMVIVAGKFKPDHALSLITKYFGAIPAPKRKLRDTYTEEPPQDGERIVTLRREGDVAVVGAVYHICAGPHADYPPIAVLEDVFTSEPSGVLYTALVKSKRAARISGSVYPLHDPGTLEFLANVSEGNDPQLLLATMLDTIDATAKDGVPKEAVARSKRRLLKQWELAAADSRKIAIQLSEWAAQGDWRLYFLYRDRLEKVTKEDVDRAAKKYLRRSNRTVGMFIPTKSPQRTKIPETPQIAKIVGDYKGRKAIAVGEDFDVSPENIEARTKRVTLSNGAKVALLKKKTRGSMVQLRMSLRYGNVKNLHGMKQATTFLPKMLLRGTKRLSRQELQDELDKHRIKLSFSGTPGTVTVTLQVKRESLPQAMKLLKEVLREPAFPKSEFEILKTATVDRLQQRLSDPQLLAVTEVRRKIDDYPKGDPRRHGTLKEQIEATKAVTRDQVRKLHAEYLGGEEALVAVVGDFDEQIVLTALEATLSNWEAERSYQRLSKQGGSGKGSTATIRTPGKANAVYFAAMTFPLKDDHPDYPDLELGNFILGGGTLSSRLATRVRQKEGLSYGVGSQFQASSQDLRSIFYVYAITNPKNMPKLKSVIREELEKLLKEGVTEKELAAAKKGYLRSLLASLLRNTLQAERTMTYYQDLEQAIEKVSTGDVLDALRKHVKIDRLHIVAAGDLKPNSESGAKSK